MHEMKTCFYGIKNEFWGGLCLLVAGVLFFFASGAALAALIRIAGAVVIATAAVRFILLMREYERGSYLTVALFNAALLFLLGGVMLVLPDGTLNFIFAAIGGYLVFSAIARAFRLTRKPKSTTSPVWWASVTLTAAVFLLGLRLLLSPADATRVTEIVAAVSLTVKGCEMLCSAMSADRSGKRKKPDEIEADFVDKTDEEI